MNCYRNAEVVNSFARTLRWTIGSDNYFKQTNLKASPLLLWTLRFWNLWIYIRHPLSRPWLRHVVKAMAWEDKEVQLDQTVTNKSLQILGQINSLVIIINLIRKTRTCHKMWIKGIIKMNSLTYHSPMLTNRIMSNESYAGW